MVGHKYYIFYFLVFCDTISGIGSDLSWSNLNLRSYDGEWSFLLDSNLEQYYLKGYKLLSYNHVGLDNGANTEQAIPKNWEREKLFEP